MNFDYSIKFMNTNASQVNYKLYTFRMHIFYVKYLANNMSLAKIRFISHGRLSLVPLVQQPSSFVLI